MLRHQLGCGGWIARPEGKFEVEQKKTRVDVQNFNVFGTRRER